MKILITTDAYNSMINGVAISVKTLAAALCESGHEVKILTLSQTRHSHREGNVYYIGSVPLKIYPDARATFSFYHSYVDELAEWQPDIIHSQCEFFTYIFARRISRLLNIPIVHTYHTLYEYYTHYFCPDEKLGRKLAALGSKYICGHTDAVIAPTKKTAHILKDYGVETPICVIPTGLSFSRLREKDFAKPYILKSELKIPEGVPVLLTLGRLAREKNIDYILQQMTLPLIRESNAHLVIVGDGPDRERLEHLVHHLQLQERVHFTGMVKPEEVKTYYRIGDVFVSASQSETQGLTYIEAMACGLPLLCRKDVCLDGVLLPGENGYAFETESEFTQGFTKLFENPVRLSVLSKNAVQTANLYSKEMFARRAVQLYKDVMIYKEEQALCTPSICIPRRIWQRAMAFSALTMNR